MATSAKAWKKASEAEEVELPSGNTALIKRPGLDSLLKAGIMPDSLTPIAQKAVSRGKGKPPEEPSEKDMLGLMEDPEKVADVFNAFDRITAMCVVDPAVVWHKRPVHPDEKDSPLEDIPFSERDEDLLYTDDVEMNDKMFIFQYVVGGTRDLETFRRELSGPLGDVADVAVDGSET